MTKCARRGRVPPLMAGIVAEKPDMSPVRDALIESIHIAHRDGDERRCDGLYKLWLFLLGRADREEE